MSSARAPAATSLAAVVLCCVLAATGCASTADKPADGATPSAAKNPLVHELILCLNDAGFEAEETWNGLLHNTAATPPSQLSAYEDALHACSDKLGYDTLVFNDAQLSQLYDQELVERDCLIGEGLAVDEPPSLQTFIDSYYSNRWEVWAASEAVNLGQDSQRKLAAVCPPPEWFFQLDGL